MTEVTIYHNPDCGTSRNTQGGYEADMLDRAGIHYELREYRADENHLSAPHVAAAIGMPAFSRSGKLARKARAFVTTPETPKPM